jgi:opacity protein-like surface antigen
MRAMFKQPLLLATLALGLTAGFSSNAHAKVYVEAGLTDISSDVNNLDLNHLGVIGVVGSTLSKNGDVSHKVEGIGGFGLSGDDIGNVNVKLQHFVGGAYRPTLRLNDVVDVYGRVGLFHTSAKASSGSRSYTESGTDAGFGFGADIYSFSVSFLTIDNTNFLSVTYKF